jgi:uncharacterized membrane protein YfcA
VDITLIVTVVFLAALIQGLSGFGFALIVMPLITLVIGLRTAAPLVALAGLSVYGINVIRFRRSVNAGELVCLGIAAASGIPVGIWVLANVDESVIKPLLGSILIAYALYTLMRPTMPRLHSRWWAYPAGFVAGCLGAAYNTPGPPVIVYGSLRQWPKDEFRAVLQSLFFLSALLVVISHLLAGNVTGEVLKLYLYAVPALALGILAASRLDGKVDRDRFRVLVTVMILILGLSLLLNLGK